MRKSISIVTVAATAMTLTPAIVAMAAASSSSTSDSSTSLETQVSFCRVDGQWLLSIMNGDGENERERVGRVNSLARIERE
jgi:hypothetical protein